MSINMLASCLPSNKYSRKIVDLARKAYVLIDKQDRISSVPRASQSNAGSSSHRPRNQGEGNRQKQNNHQGGQGHQDGDQELSPQDLWFMLNNKTDAWAILS
jgi:hypothetical protein